MTNEQAIKHLQTYSTTMGSGQTTDEQHKEAKRIAIEALSNSQKQTNSLIRTSADDVSEADVIYRQQAIDAVCMDFCGTQYKDCKNPFNVETDEYYHCEGCYSVDILNDLPSAQPEIIRCKDCENWDEQFHLCNIRDSYGWDYKPDDFCSYGKRGEENGN